MVQENQFLETVGTREILHDTVHAIEFELKPGKAMVVRAAITTNEEAQSYSLRMWISRVPFSVSIPDVYSSINIIGVYHVPTILPIKEKDATFFVEGYHIIEPSGILYVNLQNRSGANGAYVVDITEVNTDIRFNPDA